MPSTGTVPGPRVPDTLLCTQSSPTPSSLVGRSYTMQVHPSHARVLFGVVIATSMAASSVEACAPLLADSLRVRHAGGVRKGAADRRGICYSFTSHVEPCFVSG